MNSIMRAGNQKPLPWWTWVLSFIVCHLGTRLSLALQSAPGISFSHLSLPLGFILTCWWGPRALIGFSLNAIFSAHIWGITQPHQWFLYALPKIVSVSAGWWLFVKASKGKCWLPDINQLALFILFGVLPVSVINGAFLSGLLVNWGAIMPQSFLQQSGNEILVVIIDFLFLCLPLGVFLTPLMEKRGWSLTHGAGFTPLLPKERQTNLAKWESVLILIVLLLTSRLLPVEQYWAIYSPIALWAALRFGMGMAALACSWILFLVIYVSQLFPFFASGYVVGQENLAFIRLTLIIPCISAVVGGRLISDMLSEIRMRKSTEEVLRDQKVHHQSLLATMPDVILIMAPDGTYLDIHTSNEQFLVKKPEKLIGRRIQDELPAENVRLSLEAMDRAIKNQTVENFEYPLVTQDHVERWFEARVVAFEEKGEQRLLWLSRDMTEQKKAVQALQQNEARLRLITENIEDTIWIIDLDLKPIYISPSLQRLTGFTLEELQALPMEKQITPSSLALARQELAAWLNPETIRELERRASKKLKLEHYRKDGSIFLVEEIVSLLWDENDQPTAIMGVGRDMTLQQQQEQLHSTVLSTAMDGYLLIDFKGNIVDVNDAYCRLTGYSHAELLAKTIKDVEFIESTEQIEERIHRIEKSGVDRFETKHRLKNGQVVDVEVSVNYLPSSNGRMVAFVRDITARKQAENELERLNLALRTVSECTKLMVHTQREEDLLGGICRIIAELGGNYRVWVGMAEDNDEKSIRPVAQYGFEEGYFDNIKITWDDSELGQGPSGKAIRSGLPQIIHSTHFDPSFEPWKEFISHWKNASSVSLPLQGAKRVIGVLNIYTSDLDAFNTLEIELLLELASDLAYGIETLRARQDQRISEEIIHQSHDLAQKLNSVQELEQAMHLCLETALKISGTDSGGIYLFDRDSGWLNLAAYKGLSEQVTALVSSYAPDSPNVAMVLPGEPIYQNMQELPPDVVPDELRVLQSVAVIPIQHQGEILGCMNVISSSPSAIPDYQKRALISVVSQMGSVISRLRAEQALKNSEANFRTVFEQAGVGVVLEEISSGKFERVNQKFCEILGYERAEIEGRLTFRDLTHPDDLDQNRDEIESMMRSELKEFTAEKRFLHKDGYSVWVLRTITALDNVVPPTHFVLVIEDISERKRAQEEVQQRIRELEAVSRISAALRAVESPEEMYPLLMDELLEIFQTESGAIAMFDINTNRLHFVATHGWYDAAREIEVDVNSGIMGHVLNSGKSYISHEFSVDPLTTRDIRDVVPSGWGGIVSPLRTGQEIIGVLDVSVELPRVITGWETRLLETIAEIVGNTVQRLALFERTQRNMRRLGVLHSIDSTISSSLDIQFTLKMLIEHVVNELEIDAGCIHLLNPATLYMDYCAGLGFKSARVENLQIRPGNGLAGMALMERRNIHYSLANANGRLSDPLIDLERFADGIAVPLISKGKTVGSLEVYHHALLNPDQEWSDYLEALAGQAALAIEDIRMYENLQQTNLELSRAYDATIEGWSRALDLRDRETEGHTQRVTETTLRLARAMGVQGSDLNHIRLGSLLHDIGKMGIPDSILLKPGPLTAEEWDIMRMHPKYAYELLSPITFLHPALDIPYCHHEKWDGSGYPRGLKGEQIPLAARIFSVIDVWDALRSDRPYREAWDEQRVREYIHSQAGSHLDPSVVPVFLSLLEEDQEYNQ